MITTPSQSHLHTLLVGHNTCHRELKRLARLTRDANNNDTANESLRAQEVKHQTA